MDSKTGNIFRKKKDPLREKNKILSFTMSVSFVFGL